MLRGSPEMTESYQNKDAVIDNQSQNLERCLIYGSCNHTINNCQTIKTYYLIGSAIRCLKVWHKRTIV